MELWLLLSGAILLTCTILLIFLLTPNKKQKAKPVKKTTVAPTKATLPAKAQPTKASNVIELEKNKRRRKEIAHWAGDNPVIASRLVRRWLNEGKRK